MREFNLLRFSKQVVVACSFFACASVSAKTVSDDVGAFIDEMVEEHHFPRQEVQQLLQGLTPNKAILEAIARPWEAKPWYQYHPIFLTDKRVKKGIEFWKTHRKTLDRANKELGVPPEIIVAIIGVETYYGTYKGKYEVLDALYTLGFHYPPRSKFFRSELKEFLILTRDEQLNLSEIKGSYAGAMGWGQFISSSYRNYAIDFDGDGIRDLLNNPVDAIGSVANYFKAHKWLPGEMVALPAMVSGENYQRLVNKNLKYQHVWSELSNAGISISTDHSIDDSTPTKLLEFELKTGKEYWVGLPNFYVITRYNHSPLYAMAVYQLSQQIKEGMQR